ncbi:hypothetical protein B0T10DRAFT_158333 [Thelonectria olida]|uniref:Uncharacterized protein n=1 Tax=Thelonectria olida TaxID=1576542 RepID=A0A9P8VXW1_9HYPO|nr:hypothetical protein B0T10DRAFT_158333 [Thelonectria olida]
MELPSELRDIGLRIESLADWEKLLCKGCQNIETKFFKPIMDQKIEPLYRAASIIARLIIAKICLIIYQPKLFPGFDSEPAEEGRHRIYIGAIEIMEYSAILSTDLDLAPYRCCA